MSRFLEDLRDFVTEKGYHIYSIAEIKDSQPAQSIELRPANACQNVYSIAKAFTVTAVGMLVDRGCFTVDDVAARLLEEECPKTYREEWDGITVHQLLTHSAGVPGGCLDIDCLDATAFGEDYLAFLMKLPLIYAPGTSRAYSDGAFYMLSRIVEHITQEPLSQFLWHELFYKIGVKEAAWSTCPKGHCMGATGLYIRSADVVKLGEIYLHGGKWQNERILSEAWVNTVLSTPYELSPNGDSGTFGKGGMHCQNLFVNPKHNRSVCVLAYDNTDNGAIIRFEADYNG